MTPRNKFTFIISTFTVAVAVAVAVHRGHRRGDDVRERVHATRVRNANKGHKAAIVRDTHKRRLFLRGL